MNQENANSLARAIAPEDLDPGVFVTVLHVVGEHLPMFCADESSWKAIKPLRVLWLPPAFLGAGEPLKVEAVCLPWVLVKEAAGSVHTLDTRRYHLARLSEDYGKRAWKMLKERRRAGVHASDDE
jgi:hypothetical protein